MNRIGSILTIIVTILGTLIIPGPVIHAQSMMMNMGVCGPVITPPSGTYVTDNTASTFGQTNITQTTNALLSLACKVNATSYTETTATSQHTGDLRFTNSVSAAPHTWVLYMKAGASWTHYLDVAVYTNTFGAAVYTQGINISTCSAPAQGTNHAQVFGGFSAQSATFAAQPNGWCEMTLIGTPPGTSTVNDLLFQGDTASDGSGITYAGSTSQVAYFWGSAY